MAKKVTIPNWTQFGVMVAGITLFRHDDDEQTSYQAGFTLFLDNGEEVEEDRQQVITLITELVSDDQVLLATLAHARATELFYHASSTIAVIDEDGNVFESFDLEDLSEVESVPFH